MKTCLSTWPLSQREVDKERQHQQKILFMIYLSLYDEISTLTFDAYCLQQTHDIIFENFNIMPL